MLNTILDHGLARAERLVPDELVDSVLRLIEQEQVLEDRHYFSAEDLPAEFVRIHRIAEQQLDRSLRFFHAQFAYRQSGAEPLALHMDGRAYLRLTGKSLDDLPHFQLLVGVSLNDLEGEEVGNLLALPGGHLIARDFIRAHDRQLFDDKGRGRDPESFFEALNAHLEPSEQRLVPMYRHRGDMVFLHAMTPHKVQRNAGPRRPVVYFRVGQYAVTGRDTLRDPLTAMRG